MRLSRAWIVLLCFLGLPRVLAAQEADVLTGRVVDADGRPVVGARVEAMSIETEITRSVLTDSNGRYMILFPDGGGRYVLRVSFIGMAPVVRTVVREAEEELLVADVTLAPEPIALEAITVQAPGRPPGRGDAGEESTDLPQELVNRLPLPDLDPNTLALLAAGVVATELDSLSGRMGFSVAGMSELLNQITLDGIILGEGGLAVPEEGVRRTQVTTSTFDVSRGGFAGGQVSMTTARGNNRTAGSLSYRLDDDALQLRSVATANAFTRHNLGGSIGGPIIRNRLFYNFAFQFAHNTDHRFALAADDPLAAERSGVSVDSIARFLSILQGRYGVPTAGQTGPYDQLGRDLRLQGRLDWNIVQSRAQSHTLAARFNLSVNGQDSTRISPLDLAHHGGETERNSRMAALTLNSRLGTSWTNALNLSFSESWNDALPFIEMPEGLVRVTSVFEDGTRGTRNLVFGGNRTMPSEGRSRDFQLSNDLSFLLPVGGQLHRLKLGASLQRSRDETRSTDQIFGSFWFASLQDFEENRPERYERALTARETRASRLHAGLYIGDTWRVSQPLEITLGLRWDYSRLDERPAYNPAVEEAFGRRTDVQPAASGLSPRLGFTYRLSRPGEPVRSLSGGIGLFAGRAPTNLFTAAVRQTGLSDAEQRLVCVGEATPIPDWELYLEDPSAVPTTCADGTSPTLSLRVPTVTLLDPDQALPTSLRIDLGYRRPLPFGLNGSIRYTYSHGYGLWGYRDLNLDESKVFLLGNEGRPFFGDLSAIVPSTGAVSMASSRRHAAFGHVLDVASDRQSSAHQVTLQASGRVSPRVMVNANYTLLFSRDQGSGSFAGVPTAGTPNEAEWAASSNDRRHTLNLVVGYAVTPEFEVTALGRISSGLPFTPLVDRDINGDGARNDRAFVFDPATVADTAVAAGMRRLLATVPGRIRACLESQFGRIAERNSCRDGWTQTLDLRASLRPNLPGLERRLTISIDTRNALTALDRLIHGSAGMKGWGEGRRADATLLEVRGFDPETRSFRYAVNEGFGQARRGPNAFRNPFSITISARVAIGGQPFLTNRGFGDGPVAGMGPRRGGGGGRALGGFFGPGAERGAGGRAGGFNAVGLLDRMLANPLPVLLELKDTLGLTAEQVEKIQALSAALQEKLNRRREELGKRFDNLRGEEMGRVFRDIQPEIEATRREVAEALRAVEQILTAEQWSRVPARIRNPFRPPQRSER
ncbi:MAG TPA: TonB-dependent receptor [Longimicrobiales bacterium]